MFCPNCGTKNDDTATSCTSCGFGLTKAGASKFKGTMVMSSPAELQASQPPAPTPAPAAAPKPAFKGTMIGVAPPGLQHAGGAPTPSAPAPAPAPSAPPAGGGVNPLGGTMALDQVPFPPPGFGAPAGGPAAPAAPAPTVDNGPAGFGSAPGGFGAPAQPAPGAPAPGGFGGPPPGQGFGGPPPGGFGAPGFGPGGAMAPRPPTPLVVPEGTSEKEWLPALLLCVFLGGLGVHRFYVGKVGSGIAQLVTLGGCGFWSLFDLIMIAMGKFTDAEGRTLRR